MHPKTFTLPLLAALTLIASCRKDSDSILAHSGLQREKVYRCDTVQHDQPVRMFTQGGEVGDPAVIRDYLALHAWLAGAPATAAESHPYNIYSSPSQVVWYNGMVPYTATVNNGMLHMKQQDTTVIGRSTQGSIDIAYNHERSYKALREAVLEMNGSYAAVERVDVSTYETRESFEILASYRDGTIRHPYTFVANRYRYYSYPFALKRNPAPQVPAGDTLIVQEGWVEFR